MDAMISLQVSSTESVAKELNAFLRSKGYSTWICVEMDGGATFREEIVVNAAGSKCLIALMNMRWAESKECRYEFNIATRSNLTKGTPQIIPVIMESFDFGLYPLITGIMANTNAIFFNPSNPADTWNKVLAAMQMYIQPQSPDVTVTTSVPVPTPVPQEPLPDKMIEWKTKHVAQWIQSLGLAGDPQDTFTKNWVDGPMLQDITAQELQESLKLTGLQTKRFLRELNDFKNRKKVPAPASLPSVTQIGGAMFRMGGAVTSTVTSTVVGVGQQVGGTVVGVIPGARRDWNRSKRGFLTGLWEGNYEYANGQKDKMSMDVTMIGGVIAGYGTDDAVGEFYVQGVYDDNVLTCGWDKEYVGKHTVSYTGRLEGGKIKGKWEIAGDGGSGQFELSLKKGK